MIEVILVFILIGVVYFIHKYYTTKIELLELNNKLEQISRNLNQLEDLKKNISELQKSSIPIDLSLIESKIQKLEEFKTAMQLKEKGFGNRNHN